MVMTAPKQDRQFQEIELHPDAWELFTEFVKRIAKAKAQHRLPKKAGQGSSAASSPAKA